MKETTTVTTVTIAPSISDRRKDPPKSPTIWVSNRFANHRVEKPRIGKVSPPSGPWKERMTMVTVGP